MNVCEKCERTFPNKTSLMSHLKWKHERVSERTCNICKKECASSAQLKQHENTHKKASKSFKCLRNCDFTAMSKQLLKEHYKNFHGMDLEPKKLTFNNPEEFFQWKSKFEEDTRARFVNSNGSRKIKRGTVIYYICHRDGNFSSRSKNLRHLKKQGSNKIDAYCPARIVYRLTDKCVEVDYIETHLGHGMDIGRLNIADSEKRKIAEKLAAKVPFQEILNDIRDSMTHNELKRVHLLTRKDLWNIVESYNLNQKVVLHKNDYVSVDDWVSHMQSTSNIVRLYKPQGVVLEKFPELASEDFLLIIMNDAQMEILQKFGDDCICIDGTQGPKADDFQLFTLMVVDDARQGFPCCFLFSNKSTPIVMKIFLKIIKECMGKGLNPQTLMSDMDDTFYNAWCAIMSPVPTRLYCSWHVDRAWRINLNKINNEEKQASIYKKLKVLMFEPDVYTFKLMYNEFTASLYADIETKNFATYFETYKSISPSWAYCYRKNSNMNLESIHKIIKHFYIDNQKVKRLDERIHMLMKFIRDKLFDRLGVLNSGKMNTKLKCLRVRHQKSLTQCLKVADDSEYEHGWMVSSTKNAESHTVVKCNNSCQCQLRCTDCETCIHGFSCSCIDYIIRWNMCKHIHTVCTFLKHRVLTTLSSSVTCEKLNLSENKVEAAAHEKTIAVRQPSTETSTVWDKNKKITEFLNKVSQISRKIENEEQFIACMKQIAPLENIIETLSTKHGNTVNLPETLEVANKRIKTE